MGPEERRKQAVKRQQEIINLAHAENRDLTAEEQAEFDGLQETIRSAEAEITLENNQRGMHGGDNEGEEPPNAEGGVDEERARVRNIMDMCRNFNVDSETERGYIEEGTSTEEVRTLIMESLIQNNGPVGARVTRDESDKFRAAASDALLIRSGINVEDPEEGAKSLAGMSLRDLAIESMARNGQANASDLIRMSSDDLYQQLVRDYYNPTSAFPAILDNTINKSIVQMYQETPTTFQNWTTKGSLQDFKETKDREYVIGGTGDFTKVPENGELKADSPKTESLPSRKLDTYGLQFSMTRQAFIDDDIGFVSRVPGLYASRAKKTIDKNVYKVLMDNGKIFDGKALFHSDHKNIIASGTKPTQQSIQDMILAMQKQVDQFGEAIYMTPKHIIVPVGYGFDLYVILHSAQVVGSGNNDANPLFNYNIDVIESPVLNALAGNNALPWFIVADPISAKSIQVDYLNGNEMPTVRRMEAPGVLGFTWDIFLDWGIAVRDFRGIAKNPGVK